MVNVDHGKFVHPAFKNSNPAPCRIIDPMAPPIPVIKKFDNIAEPACCAQIMQDVRHDLNSFFQNAIAPRSARRGAIMC